MNPDTSPVLEETRNILKARAQELARPLENQGAAAATLQVVEFLLAREAYAVETPFVREVCPLREITPVPCTPPFVLGILSVRGRIITVIDIRKFFDLPDTAITNLNKVLVVRAADMEVGFLADAVIGGRQIDPRDLQASLPTLTGIRSEYLRGVTGGRLVVLDVERILSDKRILVNETVAFSPGNQKTNTSPP